MIELRSPSLPQPAHVHSSRCLLMQEVSPTTTVITPTEELCKGSYSFKESFQQMFSHRQHLNKRGVSHLPQSLILPVHSLHPQTQHEINSNVTRLHFPGAMRCAANSAHSDSKALHGNKIHAGLKMSPDRGQRTAWGQW